jgi:hypothetical protein
MFTSRWSKWALCIFAALVAAGCASTPEPVPLPARSEIADAPDVSAVLDAVERGIEQHNLASVLRHVSVYYRDGDGNDYSKMRAFLATMFNSYGPIDVERTETKIDVQGEHAEVHEQFRTRATPRAGSVGPDVDETGFVKVRLERVAGDWLITEWVAAAER